MQLDIRTPIGAMFSLLGLVLVAYGAATRGRDDLYAHSLGLNVNLWWGTVMLGFGAAMLWLGRRASRRPAGGPRGRDTPGETPSAQR